MATNDPNSRLTEGSANGPYTSPNGVTERQGTTGRTTSEGTATGVSVDSGAEAPPEESAGEKIGRFFRRAMDRISGHEDDAWRRGDERNQRDPDTHERSPSGDPSWQVGRSGPRDRGQNAWSDLGRSHDERNRSHRARPSGDTTGSERLSSGQQASRSVGYGQGSTGRPYGQGQGDDGRGGFPQGRYQPDPSRFGTSAGQSRGSYGQGSYGQDQSETRDRQTSDRQIDLGFQGEGYGRERLGRESAWREDQNRGQERWPDRSAQSGATGMSAAYAGSSAGFGFGRDEQRAGDWGETARDRDEGQGRRFWQREPLAAREVMTRNPKSVTRQASLREAAVIMRDENCGVVPVVDGAGRLEGILTDRDIVVRGLVDESNQRCIEDVMTDDVSAVTEDEPLTSVLDLMGRKQIRRVPVVDRNDRLLGIISMADIANRADYDEDLQDAFERISSRRSFWSLFS